MQFFPNGLSALGGDQLVTCEPLQTSGRVLWCNSTTGIDTNTGLNRESPLLTLTRADAISLAGDIIVLMDGFSEVMTAVIAPKAGVTIVGEGTSGGRPTCSLTNNQAAGGLLLPSAGTEIRNVWFKPNLQVNLASRISVVAVNVRICNCYFECGPNDRAAAIVYAGACNYAVISNTTFVSTATVMASFPYTAVQVAAACTDFTMDDVTFDDGLYGFTLDYAFQAPVVMTYLRGLGISLLNGASMFVSRIVAQDSSSGWLNIKTRTGGGRVDW